MEKEMYTRAEVAERAACSVWAVDQFVQRGILRVIQIGAGRRRRHVRIPKTDVDRLLDAAPAAQVRP